MKELIALELWNIRFLISFSILVYILLYYKKIFTNDDLYIALFIIITLFTSSILWWAKYVWYDTKADIPMYVLIIISLGFLLGYIKDKRW